MSSPVLRLAAAAMLAACVLAGWSAPAAAAPHSTQECFAFWKLLHKLQEEGVPELLAVAPEPGGAGLAASELERVLLYLDVEGRLLFRCPQFAPPPARRLPPGSASR